MARVDNSRALAKFRLLRKQADKNLPRLLENAAQWIAQRLADEVLNGQAGESYPKNYPSGVSEGAKGFVGIVSSNLRRSVGVKEITPFLQFVLQLRPSDAPYHDKIVKWSEEKYGMNFYEITAKLYGPTMAKRMEEYISKMIQEANRGKDMRHFNPFPG